MASELELGFPLPDAESGAQIILLSLLKTYLVSCDSFVWRLVYFSYVYQQLTATQGAKRRKGATPIIGVL
jgi:hypothetical protein